MINDSEVKILTGDNVIWESDAHYVAILEFAMHCW